MHLKFITALKRYWDLSFWPMPGCPSGIKLNDISSIFRNNILKKFIKQSSLSFEFFFQEVLTVALDDLTIRINLNALCVLFKLKANISIRGICLFMQNSRSFDVNHRLLLKRAADVCVVNASCRVQ